MITMTRKIFLDQRGRRKKHAATRAVQLAPQVGRIPRISKLMALAIRFDKLIRDGVVADQTALAQLARVTQPRMTQIMNLNNLAPDIQEELLFLPPIDSGRDCIHERMCRPICASYNWHEQRQMWRLIRARGAARTIE